MAFADNFELGEQVFAAVKDHCKMDWQAYTEHEFVRHLGNGSLAPEAFIYYLRQDYVFLIHFARAWALAVYKSTDLAEMQFSATVVHGILNSEMQLHVEFCAEYGISHQQLLDTEEAPANLNYTRYVLDCGMRGDLLDLFMALLPCGLGYGEIGQRLGNQTLPRDHPYRAWIETYASADYRELCAETKAVLGTIVKRTLGEDFTASPRWPGLLDIFRQATVLEVRFWQMGLDRA